MRFVWLRPKTTERWSSFLRPAAWDEEGGGGGLKAAVTSRAQSEWVSAGWAEHGGRAEQQDELLLLGFGQESQRSPTLWITLDPTPQGVDMFDNSHYPFNCFNYDGDGYPSSSTDEEKKMCRPAYRYGRFHGRIHLVGFKNLIQRYFAWIIFGL